MLHGRSIDYISLADGEVRICYTNLVPLSLGWLCCHEKCTWRSGKVRRPLLRPRSNQRCDLPPVYRAFSSLLLLRILESL